MSGVVSVGLVVLLLALAVWTVVARDAFVAVVKFTAYGLLLGLAWVRLHGIDVALTEAAIGGGLTGWLLIAASSRLRGTEAKARSEAGGAPSRALALALSAAVTAALAVCVLALPYPPPTLAPAVAAEIASTGVGNPITAVLLAFRALDTLLEAIVLVIGLVGVWSLTPNGFWGGRPGRSHRTDPDGIFAFFARVLPPIGLVVGVYMFWTGADHPGGKFQGATILAAMWMLVLITGLAEAPRISNRWLRAGIVVGPLAFIAIGFSGVVVPGAFLAYPDGLAKPLIIVIEAALMPTLVLLLGLLLYGAPERSGQP